MEVKPASQSLSQVHLPADWRLVKVSTIATVGRGRVISHREIARALTPTYPVYSSQTSSNGVMGYLDSYDFDGEYVTWTTDGANAGTVFHRNGRFSCTNVCGTIKVDRNDARFVSLILSRIAPRYVSRQLGNPKLMNDVMKQVEIPLPHSIAEQRAIAAALSDADKLLSGLDRLIAKKRDLKQAAMQELLTGETRLPGFQGGWEVKRLGDVASLNRQSVTPSSEPSQPFTHFSLPAFDNGETAQVELGAEIRSNKFRVPSNAVLLSKLNPRIPRVWAPDHVPENACASTEWLVLTPGAGIERAFLFFLCSSPAFCRQMELAATGTTGSHQRTSPNTALDIRVALPVDQKEQTAIARVLSDMDAELAALDQRKEKTRDLMQAMMQELLTGRTRMPLAEASV
jgi:restriction endonuclease S subunit